MVNLKAIQVSLKSIGSIQKITKSMKMVSAAKYGKSNKLLDIVRPFGIGALIFYDKMDIGLPDIPKNKVIFAITSDRGLCGAVHAQVSKKVLTEIRNKETTILNTSLICIGEKAKFIMQYTIPEFIILSVSNIGRNPPTFRDASNIVQKTRGIDFSEGKIVFNKFNTVVSYTTIDIPLYSFSTITSSPKLDVYSYEIEDLYSFLEFSHTALIFYTLAENSCSEQSSRMTAMENASRNAGEMIDKLQLIYNQTRQSVITQELIEIISGAAALK